MLIIGLTGGIGSGKTVAANLFLELGTHIIDTDVIAHQLTQAGTSTSNKIIKQFGPDFLLHDGQLNRKLLSQTVFENPEKKIILEKLLHPEIKEVVHDEIIACSNVPYVIVVVPLLIESTFKDMVDKIVVVDTSEENQINRVIARDGKDIGEIELIMQQQCSRPLRLQYADDILYNSGTLSNLKDAVFFLHEKYTTIAKQ